MTIDDFAILPDGRTGHDPNWDPGVVCRVRLVRAGWCGRVRGLNVSRKKRPGGATKGRVNCWDVVFRWVLDELEG